MSAVPLTNELPMNTFNPSAGTLLRQAREGAGLHIGALAVSLKVPVKKIEALEADRLDLLPDAVFARALASSICRTLKIDAGPVLAGLPQGQRTALKTDESSLNAAFNASGVAARSSIAEQLSKPFVVIGLVLVAGAALLLVLPDTFTSSKTADAGSAPQATPAGTKDAMETGTKMVSQSVAPLASGNDAKPLDGSSPSTPNSAPLAVAVAPAPPTTAAAAVPAPSAPAAAQPENLIVFTATGVSWVEVTDAAGVVQLRRTFAVGETAGASGQSPLKVTVGRKDSVKVKVRGADFDLGPVSRDNVARFEVK